MLEVKKLSAGYGGKSILHDVTVSFEKGKLTSMIGVNGSGKSTMLKAMLGILPFASGEVVMDGTDIRSMSRNEIAKRVAYLAQGKNTPDMTVEQMVLHGRFPYLSYPRRYQKIDREIAKKAMDVVGISHLSDRFLFTLSGFFHLKSSVLPIIFFNFSRRTSSCSEREMFALTLFSIFISLSLH